VFEAAQFRMRVFLSTIKTNWPKKYLKFTVVTECKRGKWYAEIGEIAAVSQ
jgi:hypothetical protein